MEILLVSILVSFFTTFFITPHFMKFFYAAGIVGLDMHKKNKPKLPSSGGICVAFGVLAGLLSYIGLQTFIHGLQSETIYLLAVISSVLMVMFVGILDDLNVRSRKVRIKEGLDIRLGLPQWIKPLLTLPAAIPLMVISAGETSMAIPFLGRINFGPLYPLILIPIGMVGASNAVNLLGGLNGSEAGMGIFYMFALGTFGLLNKSLGGIIFLIAFASLIGFIKYNWFPAKILPGDSLTYLLGSLVAAGAIVGNMEKAAIIAIMPFVIEFFLKARSKFKASCLGKLRKDGKLDAPYGKSIYSLTHVFMNLGKLTEKQVVIALILFELIFCILLFFSVP